MKENILQLRRAAILQELTFANYTQQTQVPPAPDSIALTTAIDQTAELQPGPSLAYNCPGLGRSGCWVRKVTQHRALVFHT